MANDNNETITLLSGDSQRSYLFRPTIAQRQRRVRQFQCCVCAIFLCAVVIVLVFAVSYGIGENLSNANSSSNFTLNNTVLMSSTFPWPIPDKERESSCISDFSDWGDALLAGIEALEKRDELEKLNPSLNIDSSNYKHQKSFAHSNKTRSSSRVGYVKENMQRYLYRNNKTAPLTKCNTSQAWMFKHSENTSLECSSHQRYRNIDGTCNNLLHPFAFGVAFVPFRRAIPADYADNISQPRVAKDGSELPSARVVSLTVHRPVYRNDDKFTVMLAVWGQFIDHDITATALNQGVQGKTISCCSNHSHPECFPVKIDPGDPYYGIHNVSCMEFVRSSPALTEDLGARQQLNQATAFLDGSVIYGYQSSVTNKLREFKNGRMRVYTTPDNRTLLPISMDPTDGCNREEQNKIGRYCFMTGDQRANENLHLTSLHLIWVRQHNFMASKLREVNPKWTDEQIFQETRRIIVAQLQHITYNEFLKMLFSKKIMEQSDLFPTKIGYYKKYDANLNPSIANNFATAAFRFGHTLIPALVKFIRTNSSAAEYIQFHKILFNPYRLYQRGGLDGSLLGAINTSSEASDTYFNLEVKNHLFEKPQETPEASAGCGLDLVSLNIQRGRDHGLPSYPRWRQHCGFPLIQDFDQLSGIIDDDSLARIKLIYRSADDIDLYTGAISEKPLQGGILGPTFTCLIVDQFVRLKRADRMWYENPFPPHAFTEAQLEQIRSTSLARVICDNSDSVDRVQPSVMQRVGEGNEYMTCADIPGPDLTKWKDAGLPRVPVTRNSISARPVSTVTVSKGNDIKP